MFPRIYVNETCPIEGYEAYSLRLLANPTGKEKEAWYAGLQALGERDYATFGAAACAIYSETKTSGLDFATPETAATTAERDDLPDELFGWLLLLPTRIWKARSDEITKKLEARLTTSG